MSAHYTNEVPEIKSRTSTWNFLSPAILFVGIMAFHVLVCFYQNQQLVYPLDDTYIHMAIARNVAEHGVWGVSQNLFSASSSSPLYTLLLSAVIYLTGFSIWIPLLLNVLAGLGLILMLARLSYRFLGPGRTQLVLMAFILVLPLPAIVLSGMEHTIQMLLIIALLVQTRLLFIGELRSYFIYYLTIALAAVVRYEDLFLIGWLMAVLVLNGDFRQSLYIGVAAALPVALFGIYFELNGGYFLPNPLIKKSILSAAHWSDFLKTLGDRVSGEALVFVLLTAVAVFSIPALGGSSNSRHLEPVIRINIIIVFTILTHLMFAAFGWFFRYEAYLIVSVFIAGLFAIPQLKAMNFRIARLNRLILFLMVTAISLPLLYRVHSLMVTNKAMRNIHDQQLLMARFIHSYYPNDVVALNDIGAVALNGGNEIVDMEGLGTMAVLKRGNTADASFFDSLASARNVKVAMVYAAWFNDRLPGSWTKVGEWTLRDNYICGNPTVSIYSTKASSAVMLKRQLRNFSSSVPDRVIQSGEYMK